jgi:hypothetical protein
MKVKDVAKICHEANRALCESQGDFSQPSWDDAPEWQRASAINGVAKHISGEISSPEESHNSWMLYKLKEGWRYGTKKDPEKKEHPCLVPYEYLPSDQKIKDALFKAICDVLARLPLLD